MIEKDAGKKGCDAHFGTVVLVLVRNLMKVWTVGTWR